MNLFFFFRVFFLLSHRGYENDSISFGFSKLSREAELGHEEDDGVEDLLDVREGEDGRCEVLHGGDGGRGLGEGGGGGGGEGEAHHGGLVHCRSLEL